MAFAYISPLPEYLVIDFISGIGFPVKKPADKLDQNMKMYLKLCGSKMSTVLDGLV